MPDTFLYFGYGSNMPLLRITAADRAPSAVAVGIGYAEAYRLTFHKVSQGQRYRSGKGNIEPTGSAADRVWGVLFSIPTGKEADALDESEKGYRKGDITVVTDAGPKQALTYFAEDAPDATLKPYDWYKGLVVAGAEEHGLPAEYIAWLRTIEAQPDPDSKRRAKNEALLAKVRAGLGQQ